MLYQRTETRRLLEQLIKTSIEKNLIYDDKSNLMIYDYVKPEEYSDPIIVWEWFWAIMFCTAVVESSERFC
jgi:hypothetical protein